MTALQLTTQLASLKLKAVGAGAPSDQSVTELIPQALVSPPPEMKLWDVNGESVTTVQLGYIPNSVCPDTVTFGTLYNFPSYCMWDPRLTHQVGLVAWCTCTARQTRFIGVQGHAECSAHGPCSVGITSKLEACYSLLHAPVM